MLPMLIATPSLVLVKCLQCTVNYVFCFQLLINGRNSEHTCYFHGIQNNLSINTTERALLPKREITQTQYYE